MGYIIPKKWETFQHYKDRSPPWIKLHKVILDDFDFHRLPLASKALAPCLWLLASEYEDGRIPLDYECIAFRVRWAVSEVVEAIKHLIDKQFFIHEVCASTTLAECKQSATLETETYKEEKEVEVEKEAKAKRATRLPNDWKPSEADIEFCKKNRSDLNVIAVADEFRDYWIAVAGAKGKKEDWPATWRNWVRKQYVKAGYKTKGERIAENNQRAIDEFLNESGEKTIEGEVLR